MLALKGQATQCWLGLASANASAIFSASVDVSACEMFDITTTTSPDSRNVINDTTIPPRDSPSWPTTLAGAPASVTVSRSQPRP